MSAAWPKCVLLIGQIRLGQHRVHRRYDVLARHLNSHQCRSTQSQGLHRIHRLRVFLRRNHFRHDLLHHRTGKLSTHKEYECIVGLQMLADCTVDINFILTAVRTSEALSRTVQLDRSLLYAIMHVIAVLLFHRHAAFLPVAWPVKGTRRALSWNPCIFKFLLIQVLSIVLDSKVRSNGSPRLRSGRNFRPFAFKYVSATCVLFSNRWLRLKLFLLRWSPGNKK